MEILYRKNFPLDGQTRWTKSSSHLISCLVPVQPILKASLAEHQAEAVSVFFTLDIHYAQFQSCTLETVSGVDIPTHV